MIWGGLHRGQQWTEMIEGDAKPKILLRGQPGTLSVRR